MKILFGRHSGWQNHLPEPLDCSIYTAEYADFAAADLGQADYAVPLSLEDIAQLRARCGKGGGQFLIPDEKLLALCADKKIFNETILASRYASLIPPIYPPGAGLFPYVLKRRDWLSGVGIFMIRDAADEAVHAAELASDDYYTQAYVPGCEEFSTHLLLRDGKVVYKSSNRYLMADEFAVKGNAAKPVREWFGIAQDAGVMEVLGFNGTCCLDYKIAGGRVQLLEANPRCRNSLFRDINVFLAAYIGAQTWR